MSTCEQVCAGVPDDPCRLNIDHEGWHRNQGGLMWANDHPDYRAEWKP